MTMNRELYGSDCANQVNGIGNQSGVNQLVCKKKLDLLHEKLQVVDNNMQEIYTRLVDTRCRLRGNNEVCQPEPPSTIYKAGFIAELEKMADGLIRLTNAIHDEAEKLSEI